MIRNHDQAPDALVEHLKAYDLDMLAWDLRFAQDAHPVGDTDQYYEGSGVVLRHEFTHAGTRYYIGKARRRTLILWGTQPEQIA